MSEWGFKEERLEVLDNDKSPRELRLQCTNWEGRKGRDANKNAAQPTIDGAQK